MSKEINEILLRFTGDRKRDLILENENQFEGLSPSLALKSSSLFVLLLDAVSKEVDHIGLAVAKKTRNGISDRFINDRPVNKDTELFFQRQGVTVFAESASNRREFVRIGLNQDPFITLLDRYTIEDNAIVLDVLYDVYLRGIAFALSLRCSKEIEANEIRRFVIESSIEQGPARRSDLLRSIRYRNLSTALPASDHIKGYFLSPEVKEGKVFDLDESIKNYIEAADNANQDRYSYMLLGYISSGEDILTLLPEGVFIDRSLRMELKSVLPKMSPREASRESFSMVRDQVFTVTPYRRSGGNVRSILIPEMDGSHSLLDHDGHPWLNSYLHTNLITYNSDPLKGFIKPSPVALALDGYEKETDSDTRRRVGGVGIGDKDLYITTTERLRLAPSSISEED